MLAERVDLLKQTLPHELTHVILADQFVDQPIPRWADEGMAVLADTPAKQEEHLTAFRRAYARSGSVRLVQLVGLRQYPDSDRGAFYGQSASLVQFLLEQGTPEDFTRFLSQSLEEGYDAALRKSYQIDGLAELEQRWKERLTAEKHD